MTTKKTWNSFRSVHPKYLLVQSQTMAVFLHRAYSASASAEHSATYGHVDITEALVMQSSVLPTSLA